jgi:hypothetical protein
MIVLSPSKISKKLSVEYLVNHLEKNAHFRVCGRDSMPEREDWYVKKIKSGANPEKLEPVSLCYDKSTGLYDITNGAHRIRAFIRLGIKKINCEISEK